MKNFLKFLATALVSCTAFAQNKAPIDAGPACDAACPGAGCVYRDVTAELGGIGEANRADSAIGDCEARGLRGQIARAE